MGCCVCKSLVIKVLLNNKEEVVRNNIYMNYLNIIFAVVVCGVQEPYHTDPTWWTCAQEELCRADPTRQIDGADQTLRELLLICPQTYIYPSMHNKLFYIRLWSFFHLIGSARASRSASLRVRQIIVASINTMFAFFAFFWFLCVLFSLSCHAFFLKKMNAFFALLAFSTPSNYCNIMTRVPTQNPSWQKYRTNFKMKNSTLN